ncbi:peptidoglycan DD-metalloendopeptidase family protein [Simiduia sp. 21SJ11W-1]|uniref:murein hydrolase activator EnvC family protein n=1 Tax=Simiduia sp. 21SJ11W-1 TaxID=2909669 RepID=UPI0020A1C10B|nr:peptidoglycan DD-metalloendopeptidase family protein [Simiduia sp. 21SJ11W-1]UTA48465.1 peptidoglycan DD-metalloendopeptidase family protein [Simiduia sp. 21SJ11W-1]
MAAYKTGNPSQLQLLLSQSQPDTVSRMAYYNALLLADRQTAINSYQATLAELDQIAPAIERQTEKLSQTQAQLNSRYQQLKSRKAERQRTLAKLDASIASKDVRLQKSHAERAHLEKILGEISRQLSDTALALPGQAFTARKGQMGWPTKGHMKARFGSNRAGNSLRWQGVLIGAPEGRDVKAIHQGRVVFSEYMRGQGMLIIVDHGDNYLSLYAHNQVLFKETGDWVAAGEVIAEVGTSGGQQDPSLYFEIRHAGKPVDPAHWCRG